MRIHQEGSRIFAQIGKRIPVFRPVIYLNQGFLCSPHSSRHWGGGEGSDGKVVSINRASDRRRSKSRKVIDKREKYSAENEFLRNTVRG